MSAVSDAAHVVGLLLFSVVKAASTTSASASTNEERCWTLIKVVALIHTPVPALSPLFSRSSVVSTLDLAISVISGV